MTPSGLLAPALPVLLALAAPAGKAEDPPVAVFRSLEGRWQGSFVGYDAQGVELYRLEVTQTYRTVDERTQSVVIEDRMPDGSVVRGEGANLARRNARGELEIWCDVRKSNGERVRHAGRLVRGPGGSPEFIWHSASGERSETFREAVLADGDTLAYHIDGMGKYGDRLILMAGRYRRVGD